MTTVLLACSGWVSGALGARLLHRWQVRPLWCAAAVALLWAVAALRELPHWWLPVPLALGWFAVLLGAIDLRHHRLPDVLTLPMYPVMAVLLAPAGVRALLGCLVFGAAHLLVRVISPEAMGGGDVKLAGSLGAVLGAVSWSALWVAAVLASALTLAVGLVIRSRGVPHGPGLVAATWLLAVFAL